MRTYATLRALRVGEVVNLDGLLLVQDEGEINEGDLYVAERNTGPHLLACARVNREDGWIVPVELAYCFDTSECVKVREA